MATPLLVIQGLDCRLDVPRIPAIWINGPTDDKGFPYSPRNIACWAVSDQTNDWIIAVPYSSLVTSARFVVNEGVMSSMKSQHMVVVIHSNSLRILTFVLINDPDKDKAQTFQHPVMAWSPIWLIGITVICLASTIWSSKRKVQENRLQNLFVSNNVAWKQWQVLRTII